MPRIQCPGCNKALKAPDGNERAVLRCPACGHKIRLGDAAEAPAPAPAAKAEAALASSALTQLAEPAQPAPRRTDHQVYHVGSRSRSIR